MTITLTDIYFYLHTIFAGLGTFVTFMSTTLGDFTGSVVVQNSAIGDLSFASLLFGGGLTFYIIRTLVKWFTNL